MMADVGIDISEQQNREIDLDSLWAARIAVALCGRSQVTPPGVLRLHWPLSDPAKATGSPKAVLDVFRRLRDDMEQRVQDLAGTLR